MFGYPNHSLGHHLFPCVYVPHTSGDTEQTQRLVASLSTYINHDQGEKIRALFSNQTSANLLTAAINSTPQSPLRDTIKQGHIEAFRALVDFAPIEHLLKKDHATGQSLLMATVLQGQNRMTSWLLVKLFSKLVIRDVADTPTPHQSIPFAAPYPASFEEALNDQDAHGNTALMLAAREGQEACTRILISFGANVFVANHMGKNVLHMIDHLPIESPLSRLVRDRYQRQIDRI
jgi:ankyrin repeat protein